jgi:putative spermidine/putrescine transport system substrate-binding protein
MERRHFCTLLAGSMLAANVSPVWSAQRRAVCYDCPTEWADWEQQLKNIKKVLGIEVPPDMKNAGQALAAIIAEKASPVADFFNVGANFGPLMKKAGVLQPYKPKLWDELPDGLKDPEGYWFASHNGTIGFFVNKNALRGVPIPKSWADLTTAKYRNMVGFLDPTSAAVGQLCVMAANLALGGSYDNFDPGIKYFKALKDNGAIAPKQTSYARVISGELPILLDYDFNAYRGKYIDKAPAEYVIPQEGTLSMPEVMGLVKDCPHPKEAKEVLDYILSDEGQLRWAKSFVPPIRNIKLPDDIAARFLPKEDYARAKQVDIQKFSAVAGKLVEKYKNEVY